MLDFSLIVGEHVELFCKKHGGRNSVVQLGERSWLFPDGARMWLDDGWPQMQEPSPNPIQRQELVVQHHRAMFDFHYGMVQDRIIQYRSCYKKERLLGTNREPVTYFFDSGQPPPITDFVRETERLFNVAADWKRRWEAADRKLEQLRNPPKSVEQQRLEAYQQRQEYDRQAALDDRMKSLKL